MPPSRWARPELVTGVTPLRDDLADVDAGGDAAVVQRGNRQVGVLAQDERVHALGELGDGGRRHAHVAAQGRGRGEREGAKAQRLRDGRVAQVGVGVGGTVALGVSALELSPPAL